jgi:hypothetical protein
MAENKDQIILNVVRSFLLDNDYEDGESIDVHHSFRKWENNFLLNVYVNLNTSGWMEFSRINIHFPIVEQEILALEPPGMNWSSYLKGESFFPTISDRKSVLAYDAKKNPVETEEHALLFAQSVIKYMENEGRQFEEHYSYLPNVLEQMDKLEKDGKYWYEILGGGGAYIFRGLIISKLCNDNDFERKLEKASEIYNDADNNPEVWVPYFEKLKEKLKTIEPKYNL